MLHQIVNVLFPPICVGCEREIPDGTLCSSCSGTLPALGAPRCPHCDRRVPTGELQLRCRNVLRFSHIAIAGPYAHPILKATIDTLKFQPYLQQAATPLATSLSSAIRRQWRVSHNNVVLVPVPLHPKRERERGFNQSRLIAELVSANLGVPTDSQLLIRAMDTPHQIGLSSSERKENVRGAFRATRSANPGTTYIIIDDVTTTGSTLRECAKALRTADARKIYAATVAQG